MLDRLLSRRLLFLSGKGGVGKSVVGAALALCAQRRGRRTCLVEIEAPLPAARLLGGQPGSSPIAPVEVRPGLFTINLEPTAVMEEYVRRTLHVELFVRKILQSPIYQRFYAAAPGLPELMLLGKIMDLTTERHAFDLVIVDAPSTGHGLSFLKVPAAASTAIPIGPVGNAARRIVAQLQDASRTALAVVAIPEEMAVVEGLEFLEQARDEVGISAEAVILNQCHEPVFDTREEAQVLDLLAAERGGRLARGVTLRGALVAARRQMRRRKLTRFYETRLRKATSLPLVRLPRLFVEQFAEAELRRLAARLEAA